LRYVRLNDDNIGLIGYNNEDSSPYLGIAKDFEISFEISFVFYFS
jgi:hypothetical protein